MSELWRWNQEYQDILPSEGFADRIRATMAKERKHRRRQRTLSVVGGTAAALVVAVNVSPTLVYAAKDIPLLGSLVEIVTFGRYDFQDGGYEAEVVTPEIRGLVDQDLQDRLNQEFQDNADALICAFSEDVQELKEEFGEDTVHMRVEQNYEVKTDTDDYLALDVYTFFASGSGMEKHSFYTIDKRTGQLVTLAGLFPEGTDYVTGLSSYIREEMLRRNAEENGMFWVKGQGGPMDEAGFEQIRPDQNFYINDKGHLVICFDEYEVAAGAQGSPEFEIPEDVMAALQAGQEANR